MPKFVKQGQIWNDFKENDSGAKLYITSKFATLWSFVVHVFNAMQQKARKGKSHVFHPNLQLCGLCCPCLQCHATKST